MNTNHKSLLRLTWLVTAVFITCLLGATVHPSAIAAAPEFSTALNFSAEITGTPDSRPTTWGSAGFAQNITTFHPPPGQGVRILRIYGDFIAWPMNGAPAPGTYCEIGWGLKTTAPDGSLRVDYGNDNSFVWLQGALLPAQPYARLPFDLDVSAGGLLTPDNRLISQPFVALNTTGLTIHTEATFTVVYSWVAAVQ